MKNKISLLTLLLLSIYGFSTPQIPDIFIYKGDSVQLLGGFLENGMPISIEELQSLNNSTSTNCWKGYYSIWGMENDSIFLLETRKCNSDKTIKTYRKHTNWFSGSIYLPKNEIIYNDPYSGYPPTYKNEIELVITNGIVEDKKEIDNSLLSIKYLHNDQLSVLIYDLLTEEQKNKIVKNKTIIESSFSVHIDSLTWKIDSVNFHSEPKMIDSKLIIGCLKKIDDWDRLYLHGQPYPTPWTYGIYIDKKFIRKRR